MNSSQSVARRGMASEDGAEWSAAVPQTGEPRTVRPDRSNDQPLAGHGDLSSGGYVSLALAAGLTIDGWRLFHPQRCARSAILRCPHYWILLGIHLSYLGCRFTFAGIRVRTLPSAFCTRLVPASALRIATARSFQGLVHAIFPGLVWRLADSIRFQSRGRTSFRHGWRDFRKSGAQ